MSEQPENTSENTPAAKRILPPGMEERKWQPGQSGNPGGRPKKKPVTDLYEEILNDPDAIEELRDAIRKAIRKGSMAMVLQLKEMTDRVEGKVTQTIEADVNVNMTLAERMAKAEERLNQK